MTTLDLHVPMTHRPRRNRSSAAMRDLVQETRLHPSDFVVPLFLIEGSGTVEGVGSMPGIQRMTLDLALREVEDLMKMGIRSVDLFPVVPEEKKDPYGSEAVNPTALMPEAVRLLKSEFPELHVMVDVALDPYSSFGHDGVVDDQGKILNDPSLKVLGEMCTVLADAGVDMVAPSDMMDGRIGFIRERLDEAGYTEVGIMSYAAKYASGLYGPFRDALGSAPKCGDKKTYQMNPANRREALLEAALDEAEGADMLMVKPASLYLDVIHEIKQNTPLPVSAYHVSGEYSAIMAAGERGWLDADRVLFESMLAIKRAGADVIFTYAARQVISMID